MKIMEQADSAAYKSAGFINHYQELIRTTVIPYQYEILNDRIPGIEKSHAILNFINAAKELKGDYDHDGFYGMVFQDSDLYKWIEAASYSLGIHPDDKLNNLVDEAIEIVAGAQDTDGYLNTYYTVKDREKRWTNLLEGHELYCSGHMIEAAVAYYEATGKDSLLKVAVKNADCIYRHFITEKHPGCPGHPEVELALMKLYHATGDEKYLELAKHFIDVRGVDSQYFINEAKNRNWTVWGNLGEDPDYMQAGAPVREQEKAVGHAVRAVYLYTAMAGIAAETGDEKLDAACQRLFRNIVDRRMYVTGGIGSTGMGEAFTEDFDLPNDTAYCETCASCGLMFFTSQMLSGCAHGEYADVMERAFYNTVLAGMQLDGKRFFYVNPLEVVPGISGKAVTHRHVVPKRPEWYACACCPPNVARTIESIAKYAYGENETTSYCHMFAAGDMAFKNGLKLHCETEYPYGLKVKYEVIEGEGTLAVHIPAWSQNEYTLFVDEDRFEAELKDGYIYFQVSSGMQIEINLCERIRRVYCSSDVSENSGRVAFMRGPLVYCAEGCDNEGDVLGLSAKEDGGITDLGYDPDMLSGIVPIKVTGYRVEKLKALYSEQRPVKKDIDIKMVPYYTWGNREAGQMRVWLPEA